MGRVLKFVSEAPGNRVTSQVRTGTIQIKRNLTIYDFLSD